MPNTRGEEKKRNVIVWSKIFPKFKVGDRVRVDFPDKTGKRFYGTILTISPLHDGKFAIFVDFERYNRLLPVHEDQATVIRKRKKHGKT